MSVVFSAKLTCDPSPGQYTLCDKGILFLPDSLDRPLTTKQVVIFARSKGWTAYQSPKGGWVFHCSKCRFTISP
jgi:hypothetical protein